MAPVSQELEPPKIPGRFTSDETGVRVGRANWWLWVFHHGDSAVFVADAHRSKAVVEAFLGDHRPDFWTSDRLRARPKIELSDFSSL